MLKLAAFAAVAFGVVFVPIAEGAVDDIAHILEFGVDFIRGKLFKLFNQPLAFARKNAKVAVFGIKAFDAEQGFSQMGGFFIIFKQA